MHRSTWLKLGLLALFVVGIWGGLKACGIDLMRLTPERVRAFVLSFGAFAPLVYLAAYGQPLIPLPASIMTLAGGLAFGPGWGTLAALSGATMRACSQFGVARLLGREAVAKLLKGHLASLDEKIGQHGFKAVLLVRIIPNLPFDMQNYGLGFSKVRFAPYAFGTLVGMTPGSFAYAYLGYSLTDPGNVWKVMLAIVLITALVAGQRWYVRRRAAVR